MPDLKVGLQAMPTEDFRQAATPLILDELVEVLEWSFDANWDKEQHQYPDWFESLIQVYSDENSLLGHGFRLSVLSAQTSQRQLKWLERLKHECTERKYLHISEHFGFFEAASLIDGAPLPVPYTKEAVAIGRDMLSKIIEASNKNVGLENLALAFNKDEAQNQGKFLEDLLDNSKCFLLLDLHNLYCQIFNFNLNPKEHLSSYPLHKVREIHLSGGSFSKSWSGKRNAIRRDTHDGPVPAEVFGLLELAVTMCPNLEFVILERLGNTMDGEDDFNQFRADFEKMLRIVRGDQS
ncbi:MAG: DUF692 family protein [Candidatus Melainabacteria bacterium]|nr:DUF692 family protein [Candidatus Melainabacteria bacterium]